MRSNVSYDSEGQPKIRDYRQGIVDPFILPVTIYESFNAADTHELREYMLFCINKNIRRMRKHRVISEAIYERFEVLTREVTESEKEEKQANKKGVGRIKDLVTDAISVNSELLDAPQTQCKPLKDFLRELKKNTRLLDEEHLHFDSTIESGNLERVDAMPIHHQIVDLQRASNAEVTQKYFLYCKVDTNTRGH